MFHTSSQHYVSHIVLALCSTPHIERVSHIILAQYFTSCVGSDFHTSYWTCFTHHLAQYFTSCVGTIFDISCWHFFTSHVSIVFQALCWHCASYLILALFHDSYCQCDSHLVLALFHTWCWYSFTPHITTRFHTLCWHCFTPHIATRFHTLCWHCYSQSCWHCVSLLVCHYGTHVIDSLMRLVSSINPYRCILPDVYLVRRLLFLPRSGFDLLYQYVWQGLAITLLQPLTLTIDLAT